MKLLSTIHGYDVSVFSWLMNSRIHGSLTRLCRTVSMTGDGYFYVLLMVLWCWQFGMSHLPLQAMMLAFALERPLYFILKNGFRRNRPPDAIENFSSVITPSDKFSFPSGHTSAAFLVATIVGNDQPALLFPLCLWAALVGFSRVVLGVHFPTDTLVGSVMGTGIALFSLSSAMAWF
jgi:undecaprenyl-diphosphatase